MKIFAGGSLPVSGMTLAAPQTCATDVELLPGSFVLCAAVVTVHNTMAATDSRDATLGFAKSLAPIQRVPVWPRRWGDIPKPSDEYALRAQLPCRAPWRT